MFTFRTWISSVVSGVGVGVANGSASAEKGALCRIAVRKNCESSSSSSPAPLLGGSGCPEEEEEDFAAPAAAAALTPCK